MIRGYFENCYGLKEFNLPNIDFTNENKAHYICTKRCDEELPFKGV